jgi:hypothetical protein
MRRYLLIFAGLFTLLSPAKAADSTVSALTAASALGGAELLYCVQAAADRKCTATQVVSLLLSTANTWTLGQTFTVAPTFGSITGSVQCLHVNTVGLVSGTGADCGAGGGAGANPTATAGPVAINGVAATFLRSDGAPAVQKGTNAQFGIVEGDGTTITCTAGVCSAPPAVTSRSVTAGPDTILAADLGNLVYYNSGSAVAVTQPAPSGSFASGFFTTLCNVNTGVVTVTPGSGTIGGAGTLAISAGTEAQPSCVTVQSNGTNFRLVPYYAAAGGGTVTIASGTAALATAAIASAVCATAVTVTATGTATTDTLTASFNSDPTAVTGYIPATAGMLTIISYPTANAANFRVCNNTTASITPGAITLNWRVVR